MNQHFIFQYNDSFTIEGKKLVITAIFISQSDVDQNGLAQEINEFYREHSFADRIIVLMPSFATDGTKKLFTESRAQTFARVPGKSEEYFEESLTVFEYFADGQVVFHAGKELENEAKFVKHLFRSGATIIFKNYGGLVESSPDHHFVFPSKKHCDKFIRTANVLVNSYEIFFLAVQLLPLFDKKKVIFCDTSSINTLAYAVFEIKRRFKANFDCPTVNSFRSYEIFETNTKRFSDDTLLLVSSSTSGNIIERLIAHKLADKEQIVVLYFLGTEESYQKHKSNIVCNLSCDQQTFDLGIEPFKTFDSEHSCLLCQAHSRPVYIQSDVFLTVQPRIHTVLLAVNDAPKWLSKFVQYYRGRSASSTILKNYYKEDDPDADYEIFIDTVKLFQNPSGTFTYFSKQLDKLINKHIPANIGCLVHLADVGSQHLAQMIKSKIDTNRDVPIIAMKSGFESEIPADSKCAVIVASSVVMGKEFLHISRVLRGFPEMGIIYFVGILRTIHEEYDKVLRANLAKGQGKNDDRPLFAVESITCTARKTYSSWFEEKDFLQKLLASIDEDTELGKYINSRIDVLRDNKPPVGLSNEVFLKMYNGDCLTIRKNFAFFNFDYNENEIAQSELYFTISCILTSLENKTLTESKSLKQSNYVRNILAPANFQRFNDGIIQACLLRAGKPEYFAYDLSPELSLEIKTFLLSLIEQYTTPHGEALMEFILAIGLRKLRLRREDLKEVLNKAIQCPENIISTFSHAVKNVVFEEQLSTASSQPPPQQLIDQEITTTDNPFKPTGYNSVSPYFIVNGGQRFIDLMKDVFGARELRRYDNPDGSIMHAEIQIDDSVIMLGDSSERFPPVQLVMHVYVRNVDEILKKAADAGCEIVEEPKQRDGDPDRRGTFKDFAGNMWSVGTQR